MAKQVWKYVLQNHCTFEIPQGAQIVRVGQQLGKVCMWAIVDPSSPVITREFTLIGTGYDLPDKQLEFLDTIVFEEVGLVFHAFEVM